MEQTQQYCLHSLIEVHKGHINWFRATVQFSVRKGLWFPEQKLPLPHYITHCWWKLNIGEFLLSMTLQLSRGVFAASLLEQGGASGSSCPAQASLHKAGDHRGHMPGPSLGLGTDSALCTISHCPVALGHSCPNQMDSGTQRWQMPSCSKLYWKLHALKDPHPSATKHALLYYEWRLFLVKWFNVKSTQSTLLLGQLYFAFPTAGLNDIFLIPNLCVLVCVYLLLLFKYRSSNKNTDVSL